MAQDYGARRQLSNYITVVDVWLWLVIELPFRTPSFSYSVSVASLTREVPSAGCRRRCISERGEAAEADLLGSQSNRIWAAYRDLAARP